MTHAKQIILTISLLISLTATGQQLGQIDAETAIEALFNLPSEPINYDEQYERYFLLFESPLSINEASFDQLKVLHVLSDQEIQKIISYRDSVGHIYSIQELLHLPNLGLQKLRLVSPFINTEIGQQNRDLLHGFTQHKSAYFIAQLGRRIEASDGFKDNRFIGDRNRLYWRYRNSISNQFSVGFVLEKDQGERLSPDFWSAHAMIQNQGKFKKVIVGDFQLQFGQGILFSSGLSIGKGAETVNSVQKVFHGARPYTSVVEGGFLRGITATYALNKTWSFTPFLSSLRQDATLRIIDDEQELSFGNLNTTGLHRTNTELANRKSVRETTAGFNIQRRSVFGHQLGVTFSYNHFSSPINKGAQINNLFEFSGQQNMNIGLYGNTKLKQFNAFGEVAVAQNGSIGAVFGLTGNLAPQLALALLVRHYAKDFHALRGGAFGESSRNINEQGLYLGLKYTLNRQFNIQFYYDYFKFNWLRYRLNRPSNGNDLLIKLNYSLNPSTQFYLQFRKKTKDQNLIIENNLTVKTGSAHRLAFHVNIIANQVLSLRSKIQWSTYEIAQIQTEGIAFFQDLLVNWEPLHVNLRFSIFETTGANNRQYAYENDLLFNFSVPGLTGRGIRNYLVLKYEVNRSLKLGFKIARTTYFDRQHIGSGLSRIEGNQVTDLKLQAIYRF